MNGSRRASRSRRATRWAVLLGMLALLGAAAPAQAQGFSAHVSPPRFVVQAQAGQALRQVVEIQHVGRSTGRYRVYTMDWSLDAQHAVQFSDALVPGSCRPWVALERRTLALQPGTRMPFRFEVTPPPGTVAQECRFALMIEGEEPIRAGGATQLPVSGRIGVIVYVQVGAVKAQVQILSHKSVQQDGATVAHLEVRNVGLAHGRLEGVLAATDALGQQLELAPADLPVLPGVTRWVPLNIIGEQGRVIPTVRLPLRVKGSLEAAGQSIPLQLNLTAP